MAESSRLRLPRGPASCSPALIQSHPNSSAATSRGVTAPLEVDWRPCVLFRWSAWTGAHEPRSSVTPVRRPLAERVGVNP